MNNHVLVPDIAIAHRLPAQHSGQKLYLFDKTYRRLQPAIYRCPPTNSRSRLSNLCRRPADSNALRIDEHLFRQS